MFWLHRHLLAKQGLNLKQSAKVYERIIREILRRSGYFSTPDRVLLPQLKIFSSCRVAVPNAGDKTEWNLNGQTLTVTLSLSDPISALKAKIHEETMMPPGKQKLQMENIFFKDSNTLAYYNIYPQTVVHLQIKERGGRKK